MNLVKLIMEQMSGDSLGKLGSLLNTDNETTETAAGAAVPSLLAGLAGLASQPDGARKLTGALGGFEDSMLGNLSHLLGGDTNSLFQKGGSLLTNLFGDSLLNSLSNAISRFTGLNAGAAKSLLAYLAPMVLGSVASQWRNRGGTAGALTSLFAEQKQNIADAIPAGFTMPDVPGFAKFGDASRAAGRTAEKASRSVASWAVPLAILAIGAMLLWNFMKPRLDGEQAAMQPVAGTAERTTAMKPVVPELPAGELAHLTDDLKAVFASASETFTSIKDAASADAALPQLREINAKLDAASLAIGKLPEMSRTTVHQFVEQYFNPMKEKIEAIGLIPGIRAEIKALIGDIVRKLREISGAQPATT